MPFCGKCGAEVKEGEKYCYRCGFAQQGTGSGVDPARRITGAGVKRGGSGNSMVIAAAIVLVLVFLVGAGVTVYLYFPDLIPFGKGGTEDLAVDENEDEEAEIEVGGNPPVITGAKVEQDSIVVPDRYPTIQEAVNSSRPGQVITVKPGTYYENIDLKGKEITLKSANPDDPGVVAATILDGNSRGSVVTFQSGEGPGAVLTGFTITGGSGTRRRYNITSYDGDHHRFERQYGGGILITGGSSPTITKNVIRDNTAKNMSSDEIGVGAGIAILDNSSPLIEGNVIERNIAGGYGGGVAVWYKSHPLIKNNKIENNSCADYGGGVLVAMMCDPVISGNEINHNSSSGSSGGLYIAHMSAATIEHNRISYNKAKVGAGMLVRRTYGVLIEDNIIANNKAKKNGGGLVINYQSEAAVRNNTFEDNTASAKGGAIWVSKDSHIENSPKDNTFRNNSPGNVY